MGEHFNLELAHRDGHRLHLKIAMNAFFTPGMKNVNVKFTIHDLARKQKLHFATDSGLFKSTKWSLCRHVKETINPRRVRQRKKGTLEIKKNC